MTVENAHAYIESMIQNGPSDDLHAQINVKFKSEHIHQALKERGTSKDELLKKAAGGASTEGWDKLLHRLELQLTLIKLKFILIYF